MADFQKKTKRYRRKLDRARVLTVCGAVNDSDPYSLYSLELRPAEVSPS